MTKEEIFLQNNVPLLPEYIMQRAQLLSTTLLADSTTENAAMHADIKPVSDDMRITGTALTVSLHPGDNLFLHEAIYRGAEGYVLVIDGKGYAGNAYLGDLMTRAAKAMGINGIIVDGLVRDKQELQDLQFPVFSKGYTPDGPHKNGPGEVNTTIFCGGITVQPGDFIAADADGVVVLPKEGIEDNLEQAENKLKYEDDRIQKIASFKKETHTLSTIKPSWLDAEISKFYR